MRVIPVIQGELREAEDTEITLDCFMQQKLPSKGKTGMEIHYGHISLQRV